ncbi:MAG: hypothetical protein G01um101444_333 [Parcubacteria group bacterium Gr01-1014_44]|nr:MAG: hypothetical protein G01um101444_333 [Parcubacteria group bacterium Gr01-1014_44]
MASTKDSREKIPVFVFLDENIPSVEHNVFNHVIINSRHKITIIPFPHLFKSLGIPDLYVVRLLRKMIFSKEYNIEKFLTREVRPIFIFLTCDIDFIEDAKNGKGVSEECRIQKGQENQVVYNHNSIQFPARSYPNKSFCVRVCSIILKNNDKRSSLIVKMGQAIKTILKNNLP